MVRLPAPDGSTDLQEVGTCLGDTSATHNPRQPRDVSGPDSAAPGDEASSGLDPAGRELGAESRVPAPGVHRAVPALAEVRIGDGRATRDLGRDPDGIQRVSRRRAVHSGCRDARATGQDGIRLTQWLARARRTSVDGVGEPGGQAELVQEWHQHFRLLGVGDGLHRGQVRGGRGQQFEPASVEVAHRTWGDTYRPLYSEPSARTAP